MPRVVVVVVDVVVVVVVVHATTHTHTLAAHTRRTHPHARARVTPTDDARRRADTHIMMWTFRLNPKGLSHFTVGWLVGRTLGDVGHSAYPSISSLINATVYE
jgi:hypothetical protein